MNCKTCKTCRSYTPRTPKPIDVLVGRLNKNLPVRHGICLRSYGVSISVLENQKCKLWKEREVFND